MRRRCDHDAYKLASCPNCVFEVRNRCIEFLTQSPVLCKLHDQRLSSWTGVKGRFENPNLKLLLDGGTSHLLRRRSIQGCHLTVNRLLNARSLFVSPHLPICWDAFSVQTVFDRTQIPIASQDFKVHALLLSTILKQ